jgi:hypothetical protein
VVKVLLAKYTGGAQVLLHHPYGPSKLIIGVRVAWGTNTTQDIALLDTASSWSMIHRRVTDSFSHEMELCSDPLRISSRFGVITGHLYRVDVSLLSDPGQGGDLTIPATICVSDDWPGPPVLGFGGLMERIRFAYEPESMTSAPSLWWANTDA